MTGNLDVIDQFLALFVRYIDGGFGLVGGDVHSLTSTLIAIDVTIAGIFWAARSNDEVMVQFVRKILYVGSFVYILDNFSSLTDIIFRSFATLGLKAGGGTLTIDALMKPGQLAAAGFEAAWPLLDQASRLMGFVSFFDNFITIALLLFAWVVVILCFFVLAVQLFVTIIEFKLTGLAGFTLVPFALWNRTNFLAERVLGSVVTSGVKVMVLAIIVSIGSGFFTDFASRLHGQDVDIAQAMSLVLASLSLFGLGIFGPAIASGLISGGPQLGAGSAAGSAIVAGSAVVAGSAAALAGVRSAVRLSSQPQLALASAGGGTGSGTTSADRAMPAPSGTASTGSASGASASGDGHSAESGAPDWAVRLAAEQRQRARRQNSLQLLREGERGGAGASPDLGEEKGS